MAYVVLRTINRIIREALAAIEIDDERQELALQCPHLLLDGVNSLHITNFLRRYPQAVETLSFCLTGFTVQAVEILREFLTQSTLRKMQLQGNLGNKNSGRLLSSLHGHQHVKELVLCHVGLAGTAGGDVISTLMQNNSSLIRLVIGHDPLGLDGARALQAGIRSNETVRYLCLTNCRLGDEGLSLLVDAILDRNLAITSVRLDGNRFTAKGLPHVTRLLENESLLLQAVHLDSNPGLFDNQENTRRFSSVLSQCKTVTVIRMNYCQLRSHAFVALFRSLANHAMLQSLLVYDRVQLQGADVERLLETIPMMRNLPRLSINLDFEDASVLSAFRRNTCIQHLLDENEADIASGPVFGSLERNRLLHGVVRLAIEAINLDEEEQKFYLRCDNLVIDKVIARYIADSLRLHPRAVNKLHIGCDHFTTEAVEIVRGVFVDISTLCNIRLQVNLGNDKGARLLSGLHGSTSLTELVLINVGLVGAGGGAIISELLLQVPHLKTLRCRRSSLGVEGARALQAGIRANQAVEMLGLQRCNLGNEGLSVIVDAVLEGNTIRFLCLDRNSITASGLPHVMRLLQSESSSLVGMDFNNNPGLFENDENTRLFSSALSRTKLEALRLNFCHLPGHAFITVFQALVNNNMLTTLCVYDRVQLQEPHLEGLLEIIPQMRNLGALGVNLDFTIEPVLSSFRRNTSIRYLYGGENGALITNGAAADTLNRNNRLRLANELLNSEPQRMIPLGLWAVGIASITDDSIGATGAYKILNEKLVMWWTPVSTLSTTTTTTTTTVAAAAASMPNHSSSHKKQLDKDDLTRSDNNAEPVQKCPRLL